MIRSAVLVCATLALAHSYAQAEFKTGNDLFRDCESLYAIGYVVGAQDAAEILLPLIPDAKKYCTPDKVTAGQITSVVCKHIRDNPKSRHWSAAVLVIGALREAWPCK